MAENETSTEELAGEARPVSDDLDIINKRAQQSIGFEEPAPKPKAKKKKTVKKATSSTTKKPANKTS